ncbi:unnamed protein product [Arctia plantaginis]|uniref:Uncharacterized protein n=1 Tax=Arctia plantaginis TaxID=874455 RepID=A0A8S1AMU6_ARCPL|nr:unnamed protein product [Arctia plantaginis]CAB3256918.1 unnamed protein product [Arctia plantaginis]
MFQRLNELLADVDEKIENERKILSEFNNDNYKKSLVWSLWLKTSTKTSKATSVRSRNKFVKPKQTKSQANQKAEGNLKITDIVSDWLAGKSKRKFRLKR